MGSNKASMLLVLLYGLISSGVAVWGWIGWLSLIWVLCMAVDYTTGSWAAMKAGMWSSETAREGLWHKGGMILIVLIAVITDALIGLLIHMNALSFPYTILLSPVVITWYCFTELGSIMENAAQMGARVPGFMRKALELAGRIANQSGEAAVQQAAAQVGDVKADIEETAKRTQAGEKQEEEHAQQEAESWQA